VIQRVARALQQYATSSQKNSARSPVSPQPFAKRAAIGALEFRSPSITSFK
jgi:hypothetical protein